MHESVLRANDVFNQGHFLVGFINITNNFYTQPTHFQFTKLFSLNSQKYREQLRSATKVIHEVLLSQRITDIFISMSCKKFRKLLLQSILEEKELTRYVQFR